MNLNEFKAAIIQGIPTELPTKRDYPKGSNQAPARKEILSVDEKNLQSEMRCVIFQKLGMRN